MIFATALALALSFFAPSASAASGDEHWDPQFGWPGVPERVYGLRVKGGKLYVGGFPTATGATNSGLRVWNGTNWSVLATAFGSLVIVYDFAFIGNDIYVGGVFSGVNGVTTSGLARWNGTTWSDVGGFRGAVFALKADGANLYVGGSFTNAGGLIATNIARWNGSQWSALGDGLGDGGLGANGVNALEVVNGVLYAGGAYSISGTNNLPYLARWTGSAWVALGPGVDNVVNSLATSGSDLYVAGNFTTAGGSPASRIAKWDGTNWSALGTGLSANAGCVAAQGTNVFVSGSFTTAGGVSAVRVARWNGLAWSALSLGLSDVANKMAAQGTNLFVGGQFSAADNLIMGKVARWDGAAWSALSDRPNQGIGLFVQAVAADGTNTYAGGFFEGAGRVRTSRIARWDGTNWSALGNGLKGPEANNSNVVRAIKSRGVEVFAGGAFTNAGGLSASNVARWNGSAWVPMHGGVSGTVSAIDATATDVFVGGSFTNAGGLSISNLARWNNSGWSQVGNGLSGGTVSAVLVNGTELYAGGSFTIADGGTANRIAKYSNLAWSKVGTAAENGVSGGSVFAIAVNGSDVYVGGSFTAAGSVTVSRIACWNGSVWSDLGGGISGGNRDVRGLAIVNGKLFAAGSFTSISGVGASSIAMWDGTNWTSLGGGLYHDSGSPRGAGLAAAGSDLFVGGTFAAAGGNPSYYVARWNGTMDFMPSLTLTDFARVPGAGYKFHVNANAIGQYVIDRTVDFQSWTPLHTNTSATLSFQDSNAPMARGFYRARQP